MNFKLKALVTTTIATIIISSYANALTNNEIFLVAYDATASKTFVAALGAAGSVSAFNGNNVSVNYAADANWVNLMSTATTGSVSYQVLGFYASNPSAANVYNAGDKLLVTSNNTPGSLNNGQMNALMIDVVSNIGGIGSFEALNSAVTGTSTALVFGNGADSGAAVGTKVFNRYANLTDTTASLDSTLNFYRIIRPASTANVIRQIVTPYGQSFDGVNFEASTWSLTSSGNLSFNNPVALPVPEADTSTMMLIGMSLIGFATRRPKYKHA